MIGIAGHIRTPATTREALQRHIETYVPVCRAEPGCCAFSLAFDALDPEHLLVFELWQDGMALAAHVESRHEAAWRQACKRLGTGEHALTRYDIAASAPVGGAGS